MGNLENEKLDNKNKKIKVTKTMEKNIGDMCIFRYLSVRPSTNSYL